MTVSPGCNTLLGRICSKQEGKNSWEGCHSNVKIMLLLTDSRSGLASHPVICHLTVYLRFPFLPILFFFWFFFSPQLVQCLVQNLSTVYFNSIKTKVSLCATLPPLTCVCLSCVVLLWEPIRFSRLFEDWFEKVQISMALFNRWNNERVCCIFTISFSCVKVNAKVFL